MNYAFAQFGVPGPYATKMGLDGDKLKAFSGAAAIFFHHVWVLWEVFKSQKPLGDHLVGSYKKWFREHIWTWIQSSPNLAEAWKELVRTGDLFEKEFVLWLSDLPPEKPTTPQGGGEGGV